ncbi:MAG: glutamate 5-kinase [Acidobacteriota bacterium]
MARPEIAACRRVVLKLGTRVLADDTGRLVTPRLRAIVDTAAALRRSEREVVLVSSGAVGLGRRLLGLEAADDPAERRACAAAGQSRLMGAYQRRFAAQDLICAQVLLTEDDFDHRRRCLELRATLRRLIDCGALPVLNENDAVAHGALGRLDLANRTVFSDNDRLAALVGAELGADLVVLLTDVDGVFDADPRHDPTACVIHRLENLDAVLTHLDAVPGSGLSRGGMRAKVEAAKLASQAGAHVVIARADDVDRVVAGDEVGSWARATTAPPARRRWIAWSAAVRGTLHLDAGAVTALCERHASLLPVGVRGVDGKFSVGDVVELRGPSGALIGRGLMSYDAETVRAWCRGLAPDGDHNCLIRRNDVFFVENGP